MSPNLSFNRLPGFAPLVLAVLAVWPLWSYLLRGWTAPGAEPSGALVLAGAGLAAARLYRPGAAPGSPLPVGLLLLLHAAAQGWAPALLTALLALAALAAALLALPGVDARRRLGLAGLVLLAAPWGDTLSFFLGGPLRAVSAQVVAAWLSLSGAAAAAAGACVRTGGELFSVDVPCSGVNGLWAGLVAALALAAARGLGPGGTAVMAAAALLAPIPANAWRAAALVHLARLHVENPALHQAVGVAAFAVTCTGLWLLHRHLPPAAAPETFRPGDSSRRRGGWLVAAAALAVALAPLLPSEPAAAARAPRFPGWPNRWLGAPLSPLPLAPEDRRFAALHRGPLARFALPGGETLLLRWTDTPHRGLHPAEDCYRGRGFDIVPRSPQSDGAPAGPRGRPVPAVWHRFRAESGARAWEVREVIVSENGASYSDPSWWWWCAARPGATDRGPWWSAVIQQPVR